MATAVVAFDVRKRKKEEEREEREKERKGKERERIHGCSFLVTAVERTGFDTGG